MQIGPAVSPGYKTSQTTDDRRQTDRRHAVPKARPIVRSAKNEQEHSQERLSPKQPRRYPPTFPFPLPSPFPFLSFPSLVIPSPLFPSYREVAPLKPARESGSAVSSPSGDWGEAPAGIDLGVSERNNSFDSNYYMDFCILKFVKLLIKSPSKIVLGAFVANGR